MQSDAKHQQHHANFRQLAGQRHIGNKTRRARPDNHPGQQITQQGRQAQAGGGKAQNQGQAKAGGKGGD